MWVETVHTLSYTLGYAARSFKARMPVSCPLVARPDSTRRREPLPIVLQYSTSKEYLHLAALYVIKFTGAGRTKNGVHLAASNQAAHLHSITNENRQQKNEFHTN